jgi:hypothetical protein
MAISIPAHSQINHVATAREYPQKATFLNNSPGAGSFLTQATVLVYDDILRFQNTKPKVDVRDTLTPRQKKAVYSGIKEIYQPMYGVSGSPYYDETYFNLLKGCVGSFFYKEYDRFNTNDQLNIFEFAALNLGNALYQFIDAVATDETIGEAYDDYAEQAMGVYNAYTRSNTFSVRNELKDERIKIQLWNDPDENGVSVEGDIVYAGFDADGSLVVWAANSYVSLGNSDITKFNYDFFAGNVLWFMDELVGIESDWNNAAGAGSTTAYGYAQFTEASVLTAVNRYTNHIERFNGRKDTRDWQPWGIPDGAEMQIPFWLSRLKTAVKSGKYDHEFELGRLTYDQTVALALVHLHSAASKDSNFVLLSTGDVTAAKELYTKNHHTNPDAATLNRLTGFFRIHYVPSTTIIDIAKKLPIAQSTHLLFNIVAEQIFTDKYKANVTAVKAANGVD